MRTTSSCRRPAPRLGSATAAAPAVPRPFSRPVPTCSSRNADRWHRRSPPARPVAAGDLDPPDRPPRVFRQRPPAHPGRDGDVRGGVWGPAAVRERALLHAVHGPGPYGGAAERRQTGRQRTEWRCRAALLQADCSAAHRAWRCRAALLQADRPAAHRGWRCRAAILQTDCSAAHQAWRCRAAILQTDRSAAHRGWRCRAALLQLLQQGRGGPRRRACRVGPHAHAPAAADESQAATCGAASLSPRSRTPSSCLCASHRHPQRGQLQSPPTHRPSPPSPARPSRPSGPRPGRPASPALPLLPPRTRGLRRAPCGRRASVPAADACCLRRLSRAHAGVPPGAADAAGLAGSDTHLGLP